MFTRLPYYHGTTEKLVTAFGTLFNNIMIDKIDADGNTTNRIKVPLSYAPREKFLRRIQEDAQVETNTTKPKTRLKQTLPRMSFEILSVTYDSSRKTSSLNQKVLQNPDVTNEAFARMGRVPFDYEFQLNIVTRNSQDSFRILEQILPNFRPEYTLTIKDNQIDTKTNLNIVLTSVVPSDNYEGNFDDQRRVLWTLNFNVKAWLYGPIDSLGTIHEVEVDIINPDGSGSVVTVTSADLDVNVCSDDFEFDVEIEPRI